MCGVTKLSFYALPGCHILLAAICNTMNCPPPVLGDYPCQFVKCLCGQNVCRIVLLSTWLFDAASLSSLHLVSVLRHCWWKNLKLILVGFTDLWRSRATAYVSKYNQTMTILPRPMPSCGVCPSVRLSVTFVYCVKASNHIIRIFFHWWVAAPL